MKKDLLTQLRETLVDAHPFPTARFQAFWEAFAEPFKAFPSLLDRSPTEHELQAFLVQHPTLLLRGVLDGFYAVASSRSHLFDKVQLGDQYEADFVYCHINSLCANWTFIELERSDVPLFNQAGDPSKYLVHALRQVADWEAWFCDNSAYANSILRRLLADNATQEIERHKYDSKLRREYVIVIGRRDTLNEETNRLRAQLCSSYHNLDIWTYDRLIERFQFGIFGPDKFGYGKPQSA